MKLAQQQTHVLTGGVSQSTRMTIQLNAQAFKMMFDGIYSDKVTAPFRELLTNARDGNAAVGKDTSEIDIHLPTEFDRNFWVRDYGCSMDHQFMMTRYAQIMDSTKRDDNNAVGAFGMGRVSPLSYTSTFTVTCWLGGIENVYSVFIAADGIPEVAHLSARPSTEPTGVKVAYPVRDFDVKKFCAAAQAVLFGFDPLPRIVNETYQLETPAILAEGKTWKVYSQVNSPLRRGFYAKQGCVIYPVDPYMLRELSIDLPGYILMVVDFPIGELTPTGSREGLSYDDPTKANIKKAFEGIREEITQKIVAQIESQPDYLTACAEWLKMGNGAYESTERALFQMAGQNLTWRGRPLAYRISLRNSEYLRQGVFYRDFDDKIGGTFNSLSFRKPDNSTSLALEEADNLVIYYELPGLNFGPSRMKRVLQSATKGDRNYLWLRPDSIATLDEMQKDLDWVTFIDLATVEPLKTPRGKGASPKTSLVKLRVIYAGASDGTRKQPAVYDTITPDADTIFAEAAEGEVRLYHDMMTVEAAERHLWDLVHAGLLVQGTPIYLLGALVDKRVRRIVSKPKLLKPVIDAQLEAVLGVSTLKINQQDYELQRNNSIAKELNACQTPLWGTLKTFADTYQLDAKVSGLTTPQRTVLQRYRPQVFQSVNKAAHSQARKELFEEFPIVSLILERLYDSRQISEMLDHYLPLITPSK